MRRFGLHPRWFHLVVNAPFLYGPLLLFLGGARKRNPFGKALDASAVLGLAALSVAPHQEPRFLLPTACAVFARAAPRVARLKWKRKFYVFWLVFHLAVAGFYTTIHQAGLVPLLRRVGAARGACDHVAFVGTYLPPYSVAGPRAGAELFLHDFENDAAGLGRRVAALKRELDGGAYTKLCLLYKGLGPLPDLSNASALELATLGVAALLTERRIVLDVPFMSHAFEAPFADGWNKTSLPLHSSQSSNLQNKPALWSRCANEKSPPVLAVKAMWGYQLHCKIRGSAHRARYLELFGKDAASFNPHRKIAHRIPPFGLTFGIGIHTCFGRDIAGGLGQTKDVAQAPHIGTLSNLLKSLLANHARPDPEAPPVADTATERPNWGSYPLLVGAPTQDD